MAYQGEGGRPVVNVNRTIATGIMTLTKHMAILKKNPYSYQFVWLLPCCHHYQQHLYLLLLLLLLLLLSSKDST